MSDAAIKTRTEGGILEVIVDRPKANAIDRATSTAMGEIFIELRDNPDLRVAILSGGGEKFFSAGWDLKAAAAGEAVDASYGDGGFRRNTGTREFQQAGYLCGERYLLWGRPRDCA